MSVRDQSKERKRVRVREKGREEKGREGKGNMFRISLKSGRTTKSKFLIGCGDNGDKETMNQMSHFVLWYHLFFSHLLLGDCNQIRKKEKRQKNSVFSLFFFRFVITNTSIARKSKLREWVCIYCLNISKRNKWMLNDIYYSLLLSFRLKCFRQCWLGDNNNQLCREFKINISA
jgi:hypothetical protein